MTACTTSAARFGSTSRSIFSAPRPGLAARTIGGSAHGVAQAPSEKSHQQTVAQAKRLKTLKTTYEKRMLDISVAGVAVRLMSEAVNVTEKVEEDNDFLFFFVCNGGQIYQRSLDVTSQPSNRFDGGGSRYRCGT